MWIDFVKEKPKNRQRIIIAVDSLGYKGTSQAIFIENYESEIAVGKNVCIGIDGSFYSEKAGCVKFWQSMPDYPSDLT